MATYAPRALAALLPHLLMVTVIAMAPARGEDFSTPVPGWTAVQPGEHPRLFFRQTEVAALRARMSTPQGAAILARLRATLGGGEAMPTSYNPSTAAYANTASWPEGTYTISHAAGFGMLYQLTGDTKYAGFAKQCLERAFAGQRDRDDRYSWVAPGGALRAGPTLGCYAMAYDLCYDAWTPEFRQQVALKLQNYEDAGSTSHAMVNLATAPKHSPGSNHWGPQIAGAGIAMLAIKGDPGTDATKVAQYLASIENNTKRALTEGFGDGAYFQEHEGPSNMAANSMFVPYLQAQRIANGRDFISKPNGRWVSLRWAQGVIPAPDQAQKPWYPMRHPSSYGTEDLMSGAGGMSGSGYFSQGFGAVPEGDRAAMLWVYNTFWAPKENNYDAVNYPHKALLAYVNWPTAAAVDPDGVFPRVRRDTVHNYHSFRNRWQDSNDIQVTALYGARNDGVESVIVWGLGLRTTFGTLPKTSKITAYESRPDGSATLTAGAEANINSLAVDFSRASGADALIVRTGSGAAVTGDKTGPGGAHAKATSVVAGGRTFYLMTLQVGTAPTPTVSGNSVNIGNQTISHDGEKIVFGSANPPPAAGALQLTAATTSVNENAGTATITLSRAGGTAGAVSVQYATSNGTATAGSDYTAASGTLSWAAGESANKTVIVAIADDTAVDANETFTVTLSSPTGGATLGTPTAAVVTIIDNEPGSGGGTSARFRVRRHPAVHRRDPQRGRERRHRDDHAQPHRRHRRRGQRPVRHQQRHRHRRQRLHRRQWHPGLGRGRERQQDRHRRHHRRHGSGRRRDLHRHPVEPYRRSDPRHAHGGGGDHHRQRTGFRRWYQRSRQQQRRRRRRRRLWPRQWRGGTGVPAVTGAARLPPAPLRDHERATRVFPPASAATAIRRRQGSSHAHACASRPPPRRPGRAPRLQLGRRWDARPGATGGGDRDDDQGHHRRARARRDGAGPGQRHRRDAQRNAVADRSAIHGIGRGIHRRQAGRRYPTPITRRRAGTLKRSRSASSPGFSRQGTSTMPCRRRSIAAALLLTGSLAAADTAFFTAGSALGGTGTTDRVVGAAIRADGRIVLGAVISDATPGGRTPILLNGASATTAGAVVILAADGKSVVSVTRVAAKILDLDLDGSGNILIAAGSAGVIRLDPDATVLTWSRQTAGKPCFRVDAADNGDVAALFGTETEEFAGGAAVGVYDAGGAQLGSFGAIRNCYDVAISGTLQRVFTTGFNQTNGPAHGYPVQIAHLHSRRYDGTTEWKAYDWTGAQVDEKNAEGMSQENNMADTRGTRVALGEDGKLYAAFVCAGGNHIFRYSPFDLRSGVRIAAGDMYHQFWNSGSQHKTFFARYEPATGAYLRGQQLCSRVLNTTPPTGNTCHTQQGNIAADGQGRVYIAGVTASGSNTTKTTPGLPFTSDPIAGRTETAGAYGGGPFLLVMNADMTSRLACVRTTSAGEAHALAVRTIAGVPLIAFGGSASQDRQFPAGYLWSLDPVQPTISTRSDGFFAVKTDGLSELPTVTVAASDADAAEAGAETGRFTISRSGATVAALTVGHAVSGTANAGSDYSALPATTTIPAGAASIDVVVTPIDDQVSETAETVILTVTAQAGYRVGAVSSATMTIADNDAPGTVRLSAATLAVTEGTPTVTVTVIRTDGSGGAIAVTCATATGTATAGSDYAQHSQVLSWAAGDAAAKTFTVHILDDTQPENDEAFEVRLSAVTGGATIGTPGIASVTLTDDDAAGLDIIAVVLHGTVAGTPPVTMGVGPTPIPVDNGAWSLEVQTPGARRTDVRIEARDGAHATTVLPIEIDERLAPVPAGG
jgi:hypothetical protein